MFLIIVIVSLTIFIITIIIRIVITFFIIISLLVLPKAVEVIRSSGGINIVIFTNIILYCYYHFILSFSF